MNYSELGKSLDLTQHNVKKYLDILTGTFMVRQLSPWHENISKRQVKAPKIYMRDSGILHTLLNIPDYSNLLTSPKIGASWEGFALESIMRFLKVDPQDCYFWATHAHAELDLLVFQGTQRLGYEFKFTKIPKLTKSMKIAAEDLKLDKLTVIYAGDKTIRLSANIDAIGLEKFMVKS
jgi:predicted AAA+ superfamily ATPase